MNTEIALNVLKRKQIKKNCLVIFSLNLSRKRPDKLSFTDRSYFVFNFRKVEGPDGFSPKVKHPCTKGLQLVLFWFVLEQKASRFLTGILKFK